jgi:alpha-tubulin suppressor-like RCC1 family protein
MFVHRNDCATDSTADPVKSRDLHGVKMSQHGSLGSHSSVSTGSSAHGDGGDDADENPKIMDQTATPVKDPAPDTPTVPTTGGDSSSGNSHPVDSSSSAASTDKKTTRPRRRYASPPPPQRPDAPSLRKSCALAFGSNFYHSLYGCSQQQSALYQWDTPPWTDGDNDTPEQDEIVNIACSAQSSIFLTKGGPHHVHTPGRIYQTGTIHGHVLLPPMQHPLQVTIPLPVRCVQIAAGRHFALGRMEGGYAVVSWGAGHFGQLGVGGNKDVQARMQAMQQKKGNGAVQDWTAPTFRSRPVVIERLLPHNIGSTVASIAAGDWHGLALTESGRVWAWGSNRSHQCGRKSAENGATSGSPSPTLVAPLPVPMDFAIRTITAGKSHSVAITRETNRVVCWGDSTYGQCGLLVRATRTLDGSGASTSTGRGVAPPRIVDHIPADLAIVAVAAGDAHTLALTSGGRVLAWGCNTDGQLGLTSSLPATGSSSSHSTSSIPSTSPIQPKPRLVTELDFIMIQAGQEMNRQRDQRQQEESSTDNPATPSNSPLTKIPRISTIFARGCYSVAVSSSGHVYTWGSSDVKQLGIPLPDGLTYDTLPLSDSYISNNMHEAAESTSNLQSTSPLWKDGPVLRCDTDVHVRTFDSRHNVLLPTRVSAADHLFIRQVAGGPSHLWLIGDERTPLQRELMVGLTAREVASYRHEEGIASDNPTSPRVFALPLSPSESPYPPATPDISAWSSVRSPRSGTDTTVSFGTPPVHGRPHLPVSVSSVSSPSLLGTTTKERVPKDATPNSCPQPEEPAVQHSIRANKGKDEASTRRRRFSFSAFLSRPRKSKPVAKSSPPTTVIESSQRNAAATPASVTGEIVPPATVAPGSNGPKRKSQRKSM